MVNGLWYTHVTNFGSLLLFWRCKEHPCPLGPHLELWRMLEVPDWALTSWSWFGYGHWSLTHQWSAFGLSILILKVQRTSISFKSLYGASGHDGGSWIGFWFLRCKESPCPLAPDLGLWKILEVPDSGMASWTWYGYCHWSLIHVWPKFWLSNLILKVQRTSVAFKSWFGALEHAGSSWIGFVILT